MKSKQLCLVCLFSLLCKTLFAADTNVIYVTDGEGIKMLGPFSEWRNWTRPDELAAVLEAARTNKECWSAELFPEGNWGEIVEGVQISLRLDKPVYHAGKPIKTTVLVRYSADGAKFGFMYGFSNPTTGGVINYEVYNQSNQLLAHKPDQRPRPLMVGASSETVMKGSQRKHQDLLNDSYDLTNGNYWVQASIISYHDPDAIVSYIKTNHNMEEFIKFEKSYYERNPSERPENSIIHIRSAKVTISIR